jgi:dolichyl-diphosphooligosaccharide--protein glycosyltransferase/undecaprenyl-diphosphooligosaccharide--protein glycosyltransferase
MNFINLNKEDSSLKSVALLVGVAYAFSFLIRMIWVWQFQDVEQFHWNNQLMINTNDGYYFASWVQAIVDSSHEFNPRVDNDLFKYGVVAVTAFFVKLGVSIDTAILYMPAIISSLVVIPIILIARVYKLTYLGFFAALLGSIGWSYYNRTMIGYYDTDMFSAMAPMFIIYFLVKLIEDNELKNILYASAMLAIYPFLYDQGQAIVYAMGLLYMIYMIVFHTKEKFTYNSIILISIALMPLLFVMKIVLFGVALFVILKKEFELKYSVIAAVLSVAIFLYVGNVFGLVLAKVLDYAVRGTATEGLHFFSVNQTVREAGKIPFETMANRISGSTFGLIAASLGYILMVFKHRSFIVALPLIGIGIFSLWGGLRFTVYAVPVAAMGAMFLVYSLTSYIENLKLRYGAITLFTLLLLYPNITHIMEYKIPTVFTKHEVKILEKLKSVSNPKDYTIAWWDYGYPIWYYSDTNTLIDGGKHNNDNFLVSKILTTPNQQLSANLARVSVEEYVSSNYGIVVDKIFKNRQKDQLDPNIFLDKLKSKEYVLPKKTRDIYFFLPYKMLNILPTISLFSNLDLKTGKKMRRPFFYQTTNFKESPKGINLGSQIFLHKNGGKIQIGNNLIKINKFIITIYDKNSKLRKQVQTIDTHSMINVIYMKNYHKFLVVDNKTLNSTFIQLFVLENYDKSLFEPVVLDGQVKVYKLKI